MSVRGNPVVLAGLVKRIGNIQVETLPLDFDQRLVLQKTISILQDGPEIDLGYDFNWYHRGPYSPPLARDAYRMVDLYTSAKPRTFVDDSVEARFKAFIAWVRRQPNDPSRFENFGSILYLRKRGFSPDQAFLKMLAKSPVMTPKDFKSVWDETGRPFPSD